MTTSYGINSNPRRRTMTEADIAKMNRQIDRETKVREARKAARFAPVNVAVSCGCTLTVKRWEAEQHYTPAKAVSCPRHGLVSVVTK